MLSAMQFVALGVVLLSSESAISYSGEASDSTIYALQGHALYDGKYGVVADVQRSLNPKLVECGLPTITVDGVYGKASATSIKALSSCKGIREVVGPRSASHNGVLSQSMWVILMPGRAAPSVEDRAQTLVMTYEATDYDRLEWNFCQNKPLWSAARPTGPCYTNDPSSYITWGPRGATAGHGREVQWIIARVEKTSPGLIDEAFGQLAHDVRELLRLDRESTYALLCGIYADADTRGQWTNGFKKFGSFPAVRSAYLLHYGSLDSDAAKMQVFYQLYRRLGIGPTEVDYAFFLDRATHSSPPADVQVAAQGIRNRLNSSHRSLTPANVRREIAETFPASGRAEDRLGRDVAYYVDEVTVEGLTPKELAAWNQRGQLRAADVGLSDRSGAPTLKVALSISPPPFNESHASPLPCPQSVMNPRRPAAATAESEQVRVD